MNINEFFNEHKKAALAFSGGADSAYLLYAAVKCGADIAPYFVKSQFQPEFEREDAHRLAEQLGIELHEISVDVLQFDDVTDNPADRCYYCKRRIMGAIRASAAADGYDTLIDGTNASDDGGDRPGMKVLKEQNVLSPLKLCGITKSEVRACSREAGLFTWNKPAYACLATRIPTDTAIDCETLQKIENAEQALFRLGFSDFRVRVFHGAARIQLLASQWQMDEDRRRQVTDAVGQFFDTVLLDMTPRTSRE